LIGVAVVRDVLDGFACAEIGMVVGFVVDVGLVHSVAIVGDEGIAVVLVVKIDVDLAVYHDVT